MSDLLWYWGTIAVVAVLAALAVIPQLLKLLPSAPLRPEWQVVALIEGQSIRVATWVKWIDRYALSAGGRIYVTPQLIAAPDLVWRQVIRYERMILSNEIVWGPAYLPVRVLLALWSALRRKEHPWNKEAREYARWFLAIDCFATGEWPCAGCSASASSGQIDSAGK